jgi:tRNA (guanine-N7-)-methyltransferase
MDPTPNRAHAKFDPGYAGIARDQVPPLPDSILSDPESGRLDPRAWFDDPSLPFELEIGPGKGSFILRHADANPGVNVLGIEWEWEFCAYAADRVRRRGLRNVRMLCADASDFLRWRCPASIARVIHLYFSDPWPKKKHHKNRVIQDRFLLEAHRVLVPGGELRVATDHDELWAWDLEHFRRVCAPPAGEGSLFDFGPFDPPDWADDGELIGTNYERKFRREGSAPHAGVLRTRVSAKG